MGPFCPVWPAPELHRLVKERFLPGTRQQDADRQQMLLLLLLLVTLTHGILLFLNDVLLGSDFLLAGNSYDMCSSHGMSRLTVYRAHNVYMMPYSPRPQSLRRFDISHRASSNTTRGCGSVGRAFA